jgi:hypothetical protein
MVESSPQVHANSVGQSEAAGLESSTDTEPNSGNTFLGIGDFHPQNFFQAEFSLLQLTDVLTGMHQGDGFIVDRLGADEVSYRTDVFSEETVPGLAILYRREDMVPKVQIVAV